MLPIQSLRTLLLTGLAAAFVSTMSGCVVTTRPANNTGALSTGWLLNGEPPSTACAKYGINKVTVSVVDGTQTKVLGTATTTCAAGAITVPNVPIASGVFVQVDGYAPADPATSPSWGNSPLTGTFDILRGITTQVSAPINLMQLGSTSGSAKLATAWTIGGEPAATACAKYGIVKVNVSVVDASKTQFLASGATTCAAGQILIEGVPVGTGDYIQVDGYTATDVDGKPSYGNSPLSGPFSFTAGTTTQVSPAIDMIKLGASGPSFGSVGATWTVGGEPAATGCAKYGISQVQVSVLDDKRASLVAVTVACNAGTVTIGNVPAGNNRWVQIDAIGGPAGQSWGNINLAGPISVGANQMSTSPIAIDVGKRSIVSVDWAFVGGASCGSSGVNTVYVEIRDAADKVIVPMSDGWAGKPCNLTSQSSYDARVIDYANVQPTCAIPPGAKGLVICNVATSAVGITLSGISGQAMTPLYGGSMKVANYQVGTMVNVLEPILLAPCGPSNMCTKP